MKKIEEAQEILKSGNEEGDDTDREYKSDSNNQPAHAIQLLHLDNL